MMGRLTIAFGLALLGLAPTAQAGQLDFSLANFGRAGGAADVDSFENFAGDLALALHPKFAGPGATLGSLGIDFGYHLSITDINETAPQWTAPLADSAAGALPGEILTSQFYVRKGLPYSFEMGGFLTHLHDSDVWAVALELKWSFVEGHKYAPDFGLRTHVNTLLGNRDMVMVTSGGDVFIGKSFGVAGLMQITPYAGYELTYIHSRSHVLGLFSVGGLQPDTFILPTLDFLRHRALIGLTVVGGVADFGFEAALGELQTYTFKIGLNL
jgi:hypothetical protein